VLDLTFLKQLIGSLLNVGRHSHIELERRYNFEGVMSISIILYNWKERIILAEIESLFDFSVGNAEHEVFLDVDVDLHLCHGGFSLDADLAAHDNAFILLFPVLCRVLGDC